LQAKLLDSFKAFLEISSSELPRERLGYFLIIVLEAQQPFGQGIFVGHVQGCQNLALDDGEIDLNLIQPTGMHGQRDRYGIGIHITQPRWKGTPMMGAASIHNPENSSGCLVRILGHNQVDELIESGNARVGSDASEDHAAEDVPGRMIGHSSLALVLEFDPLFVSRDCWQAGMAARQDLDRFLICREHIFIRSKPLTFPKPSVQVQDHAGPVHEVRVTREEPVAVAPRLEGILTEKTPQTAVAETSQAFFLGHHPVQVRYRESAER